MKAALQVGLSGWSFGETKAGEKITVKNLQVQDVGIVNGTTTVYLKARHPLPENERLPAVLGKRDDQVQRTAATERVLHRRESDLRLDQDRKPRGAGRQLERTCRTGSTARRK